MPPRSSIPLHELFARRWAVPVLAQMHGVGGAKLVTLTGTLEAPRASVKSSLALLGELGLVHPNPGYGHPMRPEYVLSDRGRMIAGPSLELVRGIERARAMDCALKRWSLPTLHAIDRGCARFGAIAAELSRATDRAVSMAITQLDDSALIGREIDGGRPPRPIYRVSRRAGRITPVLAELGSALSCA